MQSLVILGRQPDLGLAEIESLYGEDKVHRAGHNVALIDVDPCLFAFDRLGGSIKFCKVLTILETDNWQEIEDFLVKVSPEQSKNMPEGKMRLGLSLYGYNLSNQKILSSGLNLKKAIQKTGRSVRLIPNKSAELSSAQIIHNNLTSPTGWELIFINNDHRTIIAQTVKVQDIEAYSLRDRNRPFRDTKVGMLPPKLAQIIINLSVGLLPDESRQSVCDFPPEQIIPLKHLNKTILDPFCGTGVILQEAVLMGYKILGSDRDPRMVQYSKSNMEWAKKLLSDESTINRIGNLDQIIELADATDHKWPNFDFVATESYLGKALSSQPSTDALNKIITDCNTIITKFLINISKQVSFGTRLCIAIPAWQIKGGEFRNLPLIDQISELGYNLVRFKHAEDDKLLYFRDSQIVARQLLVITRK